MAKKKAPKLVAGGKTLSQRFNEAYVGMKEEKLKQKEKSGKCACGGKGCGKCDCGT